MPFDHNEKGSRPALVSRGELCEYGYPDYLGYAARQALDLSLEEYRAWRKEHTAEEVLEIVWPNRESPKRSPEQERRRLLSKAERLAEIFPELRS